MIDMLKVYWAGELFDAKDLAGNLLLADAVERQSGGRYRIQLPQNSECAAAQRDARNIRDADFELLFRCDVLAANFDGQELDSGTVTEFCFAKMVDMPAVLLRTDFRRGGDQTPDGDPWNLMCSHYPRTKSLCVDAMAHYLACRRQASGTAERLAGFAAAIAEKVVRALDEVTRRPAWLAADQLLQQYRTAVRSIGGTLPDRLPEAELRRLADAKAASGLFASRPA